MSVVWIALPVALLLVGLALAAFVWAVRSGQMDDLESQGFSVLEDEEERLPRPPHGEKAGD